MGRGGRIIESGKNNISRESINLSDLADQIEAVQSELNGGRGVSAARTIVAYLRVNQKDKAIACVQNEYDKFESYPELKEALEPLRNFKRFV